MDNQAQVIIACYGLFLILGGYMGWKKGSRVSLLMGLISGFFILSSLLFFAHNLQGCLLLTIIVAGFLFGAFVVRLIKTRKFMPSGMLLTITSLFILYCLSRLAQL